MKIGDRSIGPGKPVFIIAEVSANHRHDFDIAAKTVRAAARCGVDAVKLQTYTADTITLDCAAPPFLLDYGTIWDGMTLHELYREAYMPWEWQPDLKKIAQEEGVQLFSTPFDPTAVDFLEQMEVPAYKVASFEINDIPLIEKMARLGKPMIISTGIATIGEVNDAVEACRRSGCHDIALLKCTSAYPAPYEDANLAAMRTLAGIFGLPTGLSDHTLGIEVPIAAAALGASIIEKHFILDRNLGGPDSTFSIEPAELDALVRSVRNVEKAIGSGVYEISPRALSSRSLRRSLFATEDIGRGSVFNGSNVRSVRPAGGMEPAMISTLMGRKASRDISMGEPITLDCIESGSGGDSPESDGAGPSGSDGSGNE